MQQSFSIYPFDPPGDVARLRQEVRDLLARHQAKLGVPNCWVVGDPEFSRALGVAGFLGMILPREVGGHARHPLERYVVIEELLAAGAPVGAHWIADRQTARAAPALRHAKRQSRRCLPGICARRSLCLHRAVRTGGRVRPRRRAHARRGATPMDWIGCPARRSGPPTRTISHVMLALVRGPRKAVRRATRACPNSCHPDGRPRPHHQADHRPHRRASTSTKCLPRRGAAARNARWSVTQGKGWAQVTAELCARTVGARALSVVDGAADRADRRHAGC
jgi:hypothetical protein